MNELNIKVRKILNGYIIEWNNFRVGGDCANITYCKDMKQVKHEIDDYLEDRMEIEEDL